MDKDIDTMTCDELRAEIIKMLNEIDDEEILEKIYHFVKHIFMITQEEKQRKGSR